MLQMHRLIQLETVLDLLDLGRIRLEDVVHVVTGLEVACIVSEVSPPQLLDLIELGALCFHLLGYRSDKVVDAILVPLRVQNNQTLVFPAHVLFLLLVFRWY